MSHFRCYFFLEFGPARFFDNYQKQSFLSLGSDDTADLEPWCTYTATIIEIPRNSIDNQHWTIGSSFEIPFGEAHGKKKIKKYTTPQVNAAAVQYSTRVRS